MAVKERFLVIIQYRVKDTRDEKLQMFAKSAEVYRTAKYSTGYNIK